MNIRALFLLSACVLARADSFTLTSFDIPGASVFAVNGINDKGTIVGHYYDQNGIQHGFKRLADGTIITGIDAPGTPSLNGGRFYSRSTIRT